MSQFDAMLDFVRAAWSARGYVVPCLVGPPGIGKTAAVRQFAESLGEGHKVVVINAQRCIPSEVTSMTMPDQETRRMVLYNSEQLESLNDGDILFLDELLEAHRNVLSVLLTLIESRIKPDGTPLPDIMIVAATNETIPPGQLPLNIRQRFVFKKFDIDREGTKDYVWQRFCVDVGGLCRHLTAEGETYNVMTPRSFTKMIQWLDESEDRRATSMLIDSIWGSSIGTTIRQCLDERDEIRKNPERQVRDALKEITEDRGIDVACDFDNDSMQDIISKLQALPEWDEVAKLLAKMELDEDDKEDDDEIEF